MTKPTVVFFGPDGGKAVGRAPRPKVFIRTLLFSTSARGQTVESLHVNLQRGESRQNFSIWVYGDKGSLARGSGLFVGPDGIACNHHFLLPEDGADFKFTAGEYVLRVYAKRVRDHSPTVLHEVRLRVSETEADRLREVTAGLYFDWGPDQQAYHSHIDEREDEEPPLWPLLFTADRNARK